MDGQGGLLVGVVTRDVTGSLFYFTEDSRDWDGRARELLCFVSPPCFINQRNKQKRRHASRPTPGQTRFWWRMYNLIPSQRATIALPGFVKSNPGRQKNIGTREMSTIPNVLFATTSNDRPVIPVTLTLTATILCPG